MKTFAEIVKAFKSLSVLEQEAMEWAIEHARETIQDPDYNAEDDDHAPYYFQEIGSAIYEALYPPEPEPEESPEPLPVPGVGEELIYCRHCEAPRIFAFCEQRGFYCKTCNTPRIDLSVKRILQKAAGF